LEPAGTRRRQPADLNRDNKIDPFDLIEVMQHWGE